MNPCPTPQLQRSTARSLLALLTISLVSSAVAVGTDLQVSANGRHLEKLGGTPFYWMGDTGWGMSTRLERAEVEQYLTNRKNKGFTVIQMTAHFFRSASSTGYGTEEANPLNANNHRMFNGTVSNPTTSSPLTVSGGGPDAPNDYWDHMDFIVREAKERDLHLVLLPTWGSKFVNVSVPEFTAAEARTYGEFIGTRYKDESHIIWCMGGDVTPTAGSDKKPVYRAMAEGIVKGVTGTTVTYNQSHSAWDKVMMTYHPPSGQTSGSAFHTDAWLDFNMIQSGQRHPEYAFDDIVTDYNRTPAKPTLNAEATYEGYTYWATSYPANTALTMRRTLYQSMFAGGFGYTYGASASALNAADDVWAFGAGSTGTAWTNRLNITGASQIPHVNSLLTTRAWHTFAPSQGVITANMGLDELQKRATKSAVANEIMVYFPDNSSASIKNTLSSATNAQWFDPRNGNTQGASTFTAAQTRTMQPPSGWPDAVLILTVPGGGGQTPYGGTAVSIPGTIQAENFDNGGEGVAYHDLDSGNSGGQYRTTDVDIATCTDTGGGYNLGWVQGGEWLEYTVNISQSGNYNLSYRTASATTGGSFRVEANGVSVTGTLTTPVTGGWQTWQTTTTNGIALTAGQHVLRIHIIGGFNFNWFSFAAAGGGGAEVIMDNSNSTGITPTGSWVVSSASSGQYGSDYWHDGNTGQGKSVRYRPNLPSTGTYQVFARWTSHSNRASNAPIDIVHSGGTAQVQVDQRSNGGQWMSLGSYTFAAGTSGSVLIHNTGANGYVVADAVKYVP